MTRAYSELQTFYLFIQLNKHVCVYVCRHGRAKTYSITFLTVIFTYMSNYLACYAGCCGRELMSTWTATPA